MPDEPESAARAALRQGPALVVLTGPPGCGRSTLLRRVAGSVPGPAHVGGGLAMLATVPALALSRAVRARLPADDVHLLAEAVRSRVRGGLLVLDDLQHADTATIAALPHLARTCRVVVALRTPHRLAEPAVAALRAAATAWLAVPPLDPAAARALARQTAARLDDAQLNAVVVRAGGNPLAITALARQAAAGRAPVGEDIDQVGYAIATALADLPRPARTALAALGLLGRPAPPALLGTGAADLLATGLVTAEPGGALLPVSAYVAETAAGLLDAAARTDMHARLAELTPPAEAARHLAAAGDSAGAHRAALTAADRAAGGERAALLLFACGLDVPVDPRVRLAAADAALAAGRPQEAAEVLRPLAAAPPITAPAAEPWVSGSPAASAAAAEPWAAGSPSASAGGPATPTMRNSRDARPVPGFAGPLVLEAAVLRGEALLQAGDPAAAREAVRVVPDAASVPVVAGRDRVLLLAALATEPMAARELADKVAVRHPEPLPGIAAALAAVRAVHRLPGWDSALAATAAPGGDPLITRWSAWLLVEHLAADGRLLDSARAALSAAETSGAALAYGWQTRFLAAADWALALHGHHLGLPPTAPPGQDPAHPHAAGSDRPAVPPSGQLASPSAPHGGREPAPGAPPAARPGTHADQLAPPSTPHGGLAPAPGAPRPDQPVTPPFAGPDFGALAPAAPAAAGVPREGPAAVEEPAVPPLDVAWEGAEAVLRRAANLTDRALPAEARAYATAATALIEADTGLLAAARTRLGGSPEHPAPAWVAREAAWLDGQPDRAVQVPGTTGAGLLAGLHAITAQWAAHDLGVAAGAAIPVGLPGAARRTLTAWAVGSGFGAAADGWRPVALREQVRCLIAAGLTEPDRDRAVAALLQAEQLADRAGLAVLAGRARRGLRRHQIHRDTRSPRSGGRLTQRETDVLRLVAAGEPTRRIAGQLGISAETVDTHIRSSMRKLGARTRTEAAALAFAPDSFDSSEEGRR
ncbi:LuxR C-terminal-related transcriptional regulator [Actinoplanes aureus]|uniref:LuxR C-terminal-related transcriptional regulator n=1 Tax=Actinoplanes aureus TaxID=2792083 RepID=UPI0028155D84|nr:LuxR C-terminal-related transcriptional regulator [Actinoplanes aureus]